MRRATQEVSRGGSVSGRAGKEGEGVPLEAGMRHRLLRRLIRRGIWRGRDGVTLLDIGVRKEEEDAVVGKVSSSQGPSETRTSESSPSPMRRHSSFKLMLHPSIQP
jgi:hypothetical protein